MGLLSYRRNHLNRIRFRYEVLLLQLVALASLFWVHGFIFPSYQLNHHKNYDTKNKSFFSQRSHRGVSLTNQSNDVGVKFNLSVKESELEPTKRPPRKNFKDYYPSLKEFYKKHGHSNVTVGDDKDLFKFVSSTRKNYRHQIENSSNMPTKSKLSKRKLQRLSDEKLQALKDINFVWKLPSTKTKWDECYPRLQNFYIEHGHCNVTPEDDEDLHKYAASIRRNYRPQSNSNKLSSSTIHLKLKKRVLPEDKQRALEDINFWGDIRTPSRTARPGWKTWDEYFPLLKEFYNKRGHSDVSAKYDKDLYFFISSLRKNYRTHAIHTGNSTLKLKKGQHKLPDDKLQALNDIDFPWYKYRNKTFINPRKKFATMKLRKASNLIHRTKDTTSKKIVRKQYRLWNEYFPKLKEFHNIHGHCNITSSNDKDLYLWIKSLRNRQISDEKRQDLKSFGISILKPSEKKNIEMDLTNKMIPRLRSHQERFGRVSVDNKEDPELSQWTKSFTRKNNNDCTKLWALIDFPPQDGNWRNGCWDEMYQILSDLCSGNSHYREDGDANKLDHFVRDLRRQYRLRKAGTVSVLTQDRIQHLEQIGFEWVKTQKYSISHEIRWNEMIENLSAFREKYGHTEVPQEYDNNSKMGYWVMNQRSFYRMNEIGIDTTLTKERIEQLEELDFTWNVYEKQWSVMFKRLVEYHKKHGHVIFESSDFVNEKLRQWLNEQRYFYRCKIKRYRISQERIDTLESIPEFRWSGKQAKIPTKNDWNQLLGAISDRGIRPEVQAKQHWFDGVNPFEEEVKSVYSDDELLDLWNEENDQDDEDDGDNYVDDEDSRLFLRA